MFHHLQREIKLHGEWLVGLAGIYVPCTITHVQESEAFYFFSSYDSDKVLNGDTHYFADGFYQAIDQLANEINSSSDAYRHVMLESVNTRKGYYAIKRKCDCKEDHVLEFNEKICRIFGFEDPARKGVFVTANDGPRDIVADRPATLSRAIPDQGGSTYQRGRGVGAWLGGLFRKMLPYISSGVKAVVNETLRAGINVLDSLVSAGNSRERWVD